MTLLPWCSCSVWIVFVDKFLVLEPWSRFSGQDRDWRILNFCECELFCDGALWGAWFCNQQLAGSQCSTCTNFMDKKMKDKSMYLRWSSAFNIQLNHSTHLIATGKSPFKSKYHQVPICCQCLHAGCLRNLLNPWLILFDSKMNWHESTITKAPRHTESSFK